MKKISNKEIIIYVLANGFLTAFGIGIPILNIFFGFYVGYYITNKFHDNLKSIWTYSLSSSAITFIFMLLIWGNLIFKIFDPSFDFSNFGHPMILFDPKMSFIGWIVLMIVISPFLQLLTTIFSAFICLMKNNKSTKKH